MKSLVSLLAIWFVLISMGHANEERTLTSKDGKKLLVEMVTKTSTGVEVIRKSDNSKLTIPMAMLSDADQRYIESWDPSEKEKQISQAQIDAKWIIGKVDSVQTNGILVSPPGIYEGRNRGGADISPTDLAIKRFEQEKGTLPSDIQSYLAKGGTFFGSVSGKKYIAKNWIRGPSDYQKYFSLKSLFECKQLLGAIAVVPLLTTDQSIFVKTSTPLDVVDGDIVSLWIVPDETVKSENGKTYRSYRIFEK